MTVEINSLIARYIADNTRLIIPNVGTLLRRKESGEIVFMEMLKKGDGVFNSLVGNHFGLDDAQVAEAVEGYVSTIKKSLEASKKFIIDGVGVLLVGNAGNIEFIFNPSAHTIEVEQPKEEPAVVENVEEVEVAAEPATVEPEVVVVEPEVVVVEPVAEEQADEEAEPLVIDLDVEEPAEEAAEEPTEEPAEQPAEEPAEEPTTTEEAPKEKSVKLKDLYEEDDEPAVKKERKQIDLGALTSKLNIKRSPAKRGARRIKIDGITILAIVSGLIAIGTLIWGMIPTHEPLDIDTPIEIEEKI